MRLKKHPIRTIMVLLLVLASIVATLTGAMAASIDRDDVWRIYQGSVDGGMILKDAPNVEFVVPDVEGLQFNLTDYKSMNDGVTYAQYHINVSEDVPVGTYRVHILQDDESIGHITVKRINSFSHRLGELLKSITWRL